LASDAAARAEIATAESNTESTVISAADAINTGGQSAADTATDDFNPKLQVSTDALNATGDGDGGGITLSWADIVFGKDRETTNVGQHHKFVVRLQEAELFEPLKNAITDTAVRDEVEESLGDFDDVIVDFRLSLDSRKYGRDIQRHSDLIDEIQRAAVETLTEEIDNLLGATDQFDILSQRFASDGVDFDAPMTDVLDSNQILAVVSAAAAERAAHATYASGYTEAARASGLFDLVDLVNNQPQLTMTIEGRIRDDLVGPDKTSLVFTYELGRKNVNSFRRYQANQRVAEIPQAAAGIVASVAAAAQAAARANPENANAVATAAINAAIAAEAAEAANPGADPRVAAEARAVAAAADSSARSMPRNGQAAADAAAAAASTAATRIGTQTCASTATCLRQYIDENRDSIRQGDRLSFSLAFVDTDDFHYDSGGVLLDVPSERSLVAQLKYGRNLGARDGDAVFGGRRSRIDLTASFEDVNDDPARQNRSLANVTFSQEVSQGLFLTVGLVWANKPEYRGAVEEELSARAGINYKLASSQQ
jgi:hypothetical protein